MKKKPTVYHGFSHAPAPPGEEFRRLLRNAFCAADERESMPLRSVPAPSPPSPAPSAFSRAPAPVPAPAVAASGGAPDPGDDSASSRPRATFFRMRDAARSDAERPAAASSPSFLW